MLVKQLISPSGSTINGPLLLTPQAFGDKGLVYWKLAPAG